MRAWKLWFALCIAACSKADPEPAPEVPPAAEAVPVERALSETTQPRTATQLPPDAGAPASDEGGVWTWFARDDDVPLCIFSDYDAYGQASFLKDVKRAATLRAKQALVFGTYAPGCASRDCVRRPTLQCWADVDGKSITVHTRYSGQHRDESACSANCEPVTAACKTPELEAGSYRLQYGDRTRVVKVPGVARPACLRSD